MSGPFADSIRDQLVAAGYEQVRQRRRRRRTRIGAAVSAAVAAMTATVLVLNPSPAAADVEVTVSNGFVEVRLTDLDSTAADVVKALADKDIEAQVEAASSGPSRVGRFTSVDVIGANVQIERINDTDGVFLGFRVAQGWPGTLVITIGAAAEPGQPYDQLSDPFGSGEPLDCRGVLGHRLADVAGELDGLRVRVQVASSGVIGTQQPLSDVLASTDAGLIITGGQALSATDVLLQVGPSEPFEEPGC